MARISDCECGYVARGDDDAVIADLEAPETTPSWSTET